jgi:hypothetical protein
VKGETKLDGDAMHLLTEMECAGPQDTSEQVLIGRLVGGLPERREDGNGFIVGTPLAYMEMAEDQETRFR